MIIEGGSHDGIIIAAVNTLKVLVSLGMCHWSETLKGFVSAGLKVVRSGEKGRKATRSPPEVPRVQFSRAVRT